MKPSQSSQPSQMPLWLTTSYPTTSYPITPYPTTPFPTERQPPNPPMTPIPTLSLFQGPPNPTITPIPIPTPITGPVARDDEVSFSANEGRAFIPVLENDTPAPGKELAVRAITSNASNGSCNISLDLLEVVYVPNEGFVGADSCVYEACDSVPECDTETLTIEVRDSLLD